MKKLHSLFILSILALTMFVGCQMPTEDVKDVLSTTYRVNVTENTYKANVSVDNVTPKAGDTVVITITVPADFSADDLKLSVMKGTETVTFTDVESTETNKVKKSFTMPESDVTVTVNFEKKATSTDDNGGEEVVEPNYTVLAPDGSVFASNMPYSDFDYYKTILTKDVDYVEIDEYTCKLTEVGYAKVTNNTPVTDNPSDGDTEENPTPNPTETSTETYKVNHGNDTGTYSLEFDNYKAGYTKGETVKFLIKNGDATPTGLYLVKVHIYEGETELTDIPVTVTKDHKIQFTMPDKDINVFAQFQDVKTKPSADVTEGEDIVNNYKAAVMGTPSVPVRLVLCFDNKDYDNLSEVKVDGKYVFDLGLLGTGKPFYFTEICSNPIFGVIDNGLKILNPVVDNKIFMYNPNAGSLSK